MKRNILIFACACLLSVFVAERLRTASAQSGAPVISTIAGGAGSGADAKLAALGKVFATALDPLGRGFYLIEDANPTLSLRFVNTGNAAVTLAGQVIQPHNTRVLAGGGARGLEMGIVSGLAVDPSGNAVYFTELSNRFGAYIRALNVGAQAFTVQGVTIAPGQMETIVTTGKPSGSNQAAVGFMDPQGLALHPATREFYTIGSLPDANAKGVFRFDANGNAYLVAGTANAGTHNGDGGPATQARFIAPQNPAFDRAGNLFIVDAGSPRATGTPGSVRVVNAGGIISTLATGLLYPVGIAVAPTGDVAYVAAGNGQQVVRLRVGSPPETVAGRLRQQCDTSIANWTCGDGGTATAAQLGLPTSTDNRNLILASDAAGVYLPDYHNRVVRYVNLSNSVATPAGTNVPALGIETIAGTKNLPPYDQGPAIGGVLKAPTGLAADAQGNLFIADSEQRRLRFVNRGATPVTLFAGTLSEQTVAPGHIVTLNQRAGGQNFGDQIAGASFAAPAGVAVTSRGLWVVDAQGGAVIKPAGQATGPRSGRLFFVNTSSQTVTIYPQSATSVQVAPGAFAAVAGVSVQPVYDAEFKPIGDTGPATNAIIFPSDVAVDGAGNIYVSDWVNKRIRRINGATGVINSLSVQVGYPTGIALDAQDRLYIADTNDNRILRQDVAAGATFTAIQMRAKISPTDSGAQPRDVAVDADGRMFVTISETSQVFEVNAPPGALSSVKVLAGSGEPGFGGDGGPAGAARLNLRLNAPYSESSSNSFNTTQPPIGIAVLPNGEVLFADLNNHRVRRIGNGEARPLLAAVANQSVLENETLAINFVVADAAAGSAQFALTGNPAFGAFTDNGNGTARLVLTPGFEDADLYRLGISVAQAGRTETQNFTLTVVNNNRLPVILTAVGNQSIINGHVRELELAFADADGEPVETRLNNAPAFVTLLPDAEDLFKAKLRIAPNLTGVALPAVFENITLTLEDINHGRSVSLRFNLLVTASVISSFPVINVSSAGFLPGALAPNTIVAAFGTNLAIETRTAMATPLPTSLAGTSVTIKDSAGVERFAPLFFISPTQVNYLLPGDTAVGPATINVLSGSGRLSSQQVQIERVAPGMFSMDASGRGLAAAVALRLKADGTSHYELIARFDTSQNRFIGLPIDLGPEGDQVFLVLYGTGLRHRGHLNMVGARVGGIAARVDFAGAQGDLAGLDQVNVLLPRSLNGSGEVEVSLTVEGRAANPVKVRLK